MKRSALLLGLLLATSFEAAGDPPREFDWGPLASRQIDINGDVRFRLLGPIVERTTSVRDQQLSAFRPLYSRATDPESGWEFHDYLWPLGLSKSIGDEYEWRFTLAYYWNHDTTSEDPRRRFWLFPILFWGRSADHETYRAVFPLGGRIEDVLLRDEVFFILFPLYARSELGPIESKSWLWPVVSRTEGKGIYRFRLFPFYGRAKHREEFRKRFIMWPIWTSSEFYYPSSSGSGYILFPLYGHMDLSDQESWLFLPPFFRFTRSERLNLTYCPWPFFQKTSGETEKLYLWPLWGRKRTPGTRSGFVLWPLYLSWDVDRGGTVTHRRQLTPFWHASADRLRLSTGEESEEVASSYKKLWPVFSAQREGESYRYRALELWPMRKNYGSIERGWAPLWTVWSRAGNAEGWDTEFLWGLYRRQRQGAGFNRVSLFPLVSWERDDRPGETPSREWSLLKGLVGYRREDTQRSFRVLYFLTFGGKNENR